MTRRGTADAASDAGTDLPGGPRPAPAGGDGLAEAHREADPLLRYPAAYLAALRAAAAVLAVRARPKPRRGAPRDVWHLLAEVAPELGEWAAFFASCSDTRAAAEAGIARLVGRRDADDLLRQAEQFVGIVGRWFRCADRGRSDVRGGRAVRCGRPRSTVHGRCRCRGGGALFAGRDRSAVARIGLAVLVGPVGPVRFPTVRTSAAHGRARW